MVAEDLFDDLLAVRTRASIEKVTLTFGDLILTSVDGDNDLFIRAQDEAQEGSAGRLVYHLADGGTAAYDFHVGPGNELILADGSGSGLHFGAGPERPRSARQPLDAGASLLQPVSAHELASLEAALHRLEQAVRLDELDELQEARLRAVLEMAERQRRDAAPGTTERWKTVGPVLGAAWYVWAQFPTHAGKWLEFISKLDEMGWLETAQTLGHAAH